MRASCVYDSDENKQETVFPMLPTSQTAISHNHAKQPFMTRDASAERIQSQQQRSNSGQQQNGSKR